MNASEFIRDFSSAAEYLAQHKDEINKLNVFPVPDGDTGTNMSLTISSVVKELTALPAEAGLPEILKAITHGSLMGARGNSGVITSQILRGFSEGLADATEFDSFTVAVALEKAVEVAFTAVRRPVEGTILTVVRDMSTAANEAAQACLPVNVALKDIVVAAFASVRRTPELLPVLKENNVVDAGGYGLALLAQGFVLALLGGDPAVEDVQALTSARNPLVAIEQIDDWEGSEYLYCTEFLFQSADIDTAATLDFLSRMGDCELMVGSQPDFKIHVHTDNPGQVLEYMCARGQVYEVHIHNMRLQSQERNVSLAAEAQTASAAGSLEIADAALTAPPKPRGYVAVCSGDGLAKILESLGVDIIVSGGQTMNPSTAELLAAIEAVNAAEVVVFPNNKNIIMTAQAAVAVASKPAVVVATQNVPESFSALFVANPALTLAEEAAEMQAAISLVKEAEITYAIKSAKSKTGQKIHAGDVIGISNDVIEVVGPSVTSVALDLVERITGTDCDTLTLLAGEQLAQPDFETLVEQIVTRFPDLEVDARRGEQPLYPLVMAAE